MATSSIAYHEIDIKTYKTKVVNRLRREEVDGKGQVIELDQVEIGGSAIPFCVFVTTGISLALVISMETSLACWATYKTIFALIRRRIGGLILEPCRDFINFGVVHRKHEKWSKLRKREHKKEQTSVSSGECFIHALCGSKKYYPGNGLNARSWDAYEEYDVYHQDHLSKAILELINSVKLVIVLDNTKVSDYCFINVPSGNELIEERLRQRLRKGLAHKGLHLYDGFLSGLTQISRGFWEYPAGHASILNAAAEKGVPNLWFGIPAVTWKDEGPTLKPERSLININVFLISELLKELKRSEKQKNKK